MTVAQTVPGMPASKYEQFKREIVAAIARDLEPLGAEIEETETLPYDRLMPLLREMRAFALLVPPEFGGVGLSVQQYLPILAEFSKAHGGIRVLVHVHNSMTHALWALADDEQRSRFLPGAGNGECSVAFALTEPDHGTGLDIGTVARQEQGEYVIDGRKWLITNSNIASHFLVFAKTAPDAVSVLVVERGCPGLSIEPLPETMGCKGGEHGMLTFAGARVPVENLLRGEGEGIAAMEEALELSRLFIAASSLGTAERALELSIAYSRERTTFGKPIAQRQAIQRYLAEMAVDVHALRNMISDAAAKVDAGQRIPLEASICKLFGLEAVGRVTDRALLVHGGIGYTRKHQIERLYRDARLNWLEEGPPTIQQLVIARELLGGEA